MSLQHANTVTVGIEVERFDSEWIPLVFQMFWCKQRSDIGLVDWANEEVGLFSVRTFPVNLVKRMKVGERRRYWVRMRMESHRDYWGEWDSSVEFLKLKRAR